MNTTLEKIQFINKVKELLEKVTTESYLSDLKLCRFQLDDIYEIETDGYAEIGQHFKVNIYLKSATEIEESTEVILDLIEIQQYIVYRELHINSDEAEIFSERLDWSECRNEWFTESILKSYIHDVLQGRISHQKQKFYIKSYPGCPVTDLVDYNINSI